MSLASIPIIEKQIRDYELRLTEAELRADEDALKNLLSDDFKGVNHRGMRVNKKNFIFGLCHADLVMDKLDIEDLEIVVEASLAIVYGKSVFDIIVNDQVVHGSAQYIDIWRLIGEEWKLQVSSVTPIR